jgi:hypothetical protein
MRFCAKSFIFDVSFSSTLTATYTQTVYDLVRTYCTALLQPFMLLILRALQPLKLFLPLPQGVHYSNF